MFLRLGSLWKEIMNVRKYLIDTNIFLRAIVKDDLRKGEVCESLLKLLAYKQQDFFASSLVLAEVVWTLLRVYKYQKGDVAEVVRSILTIGNLKIEDRYTPVIAVDLFTANNVKFADCLLASHPEIVSGAVTVISYDRDFDVLGVKRIEPGQLI